MDKTTIIQRLLELPNEIEAAENEVIEMCEKVSKAKDDLTGKESVLLLSGKIDGKNAEIRSAQLRELALQERQAVNDAENALSGARAYLTKLQNTFRALQTITQLLGREVA